jgi:predicted component of type VI protein secretion system
LSGTFVNDERVTIERELHDKDRLRVGPLVFAVHVATEPAISTQPEPADERAAAAFLLSLHDQRDPGAVSDSGKALVETVSVKATVTSTETVLAKPEKAEGTNSQAKFAADDTPAVAGAILERYLRRRHK